MKQDVLKSAFAINEFSRKTLNNMVKAWEDVAGKARSWSGAIDPDLVNRGALDTLKRHMQECLDSKGGEVSARRNTVELGNLYLHLSSHGKQAFLKLLATEFDIDRRALGQLLKTVQAATSLDDCIRAEVSLREALEAPRMRILTQFSGLPEGIKFLVDMRSDLLAFAAKDPALNALEADMRKLLATWFDIGLLDMEIITWESPAALLEKLIAYEAVHAIRSWNDLKNRLDSDRRCYAFFHPKMPHEPLIFVEVALVNGLADNIQTLLDEHSPVTDSREADTAIFYSISNAQKGLVGISFGNFLIKRVVEDLLRHHKAIRQFSTLSPIPGFRKWLEPRLQAGDESLISPAERKALLDLRGRGNAALALADILATDWHTNPAIAEVVKPAIMRHGTHYLLNEKRGQKALDPVANFHLSNGAVMERLNWLADTSVKGMKESAGLMVNYLYDRGRIDDNHEAYGREGNITASKAFKAWLRSY